jgi:DNA-binding LytR/AlgR family response regulator
MNPIPSVSFAVGPAAAASGATVSASVSDHQGVETPSRLRRPARTASAVESVDRLGSVVPTTPALPAGLTEGLGAKGDFVERLLIRDDGQLLVARLEDVDWIEGDGNYILLHVGETTHRLRCSLGGLAPRLDPRRFVRIHRSAIVNVHRIAALKPRLSGTYDLVLEGGTKLSLSRSHRRKILELLGRGA